MGLVEGNGVAGEAAARGHVPLDVDGYPVAPAELELQQVHIYVRHGASARICGIFLLSNEPTPLRVSAKPGERTPVGVRMAGPPAIIPENWMFCNTARQFRAAVAGVGPEDSTVAFPPVQAEPGREELRIHRVVERADGTTAVGQW